MIPAGPSTTTQPPSTGSSSERPRSVVIAGGGSLGAAIAARLPAGWAVVVVDPDPAAQARVRAARPDAGFVAGDATSRLVLAKAGMDTKTVLVAASGDAAVNQEAARVAREAFGVEERVVVGGSPGEETGLSPAECVAPLDAVAGRVVNRISIAASRAVDVGLGIGELLQVTVLDGSPAAGRTLREFGARHWLVGAVYRADHLIVPHGDTRVEVGDRVLLVGEPSVLDDVAPFFRGGAPVFPSQYGARIGHPGTGGAETMARWLAERVGADGVVAIPPIGGTGADPDLAALDIGCVVLEPVTLPWYVWLGLLRSRLHAAIVSGRRPVYLWRTGPPVRSILVCVRDVRAQRDVVLAAIDLARQLGAALTAITVGPGLESVGDDLDRLTRLHGVEVAHRRVEGNPVTRLREAAQGHDLLVVGIRKEHNSPLAPDVSTFLLHAAPSSVLFIPYAASD